MHKTLHAVLLLLVFVTTSLVPLSLAAQSVATIPTSQCVWHAGDDPAWAAPNLDESGWQPYAQWKADDNRLQIWIRCHTSLAASPDASLDASLDALRGTDHPAIQLGIDAAYQIYLDGSYLGGSGNLRNANFSINSIRSFPVPAAQIHSGAATIAVRVTHHSAIVTGGPIVSLLTQRLTLRLGDHDTLDALRARTVLARSYAYADIAICYGVIGVVALIMLGLFLSDPSRRELLLLSIGCLSLAALRLNEFCAASLLNYSVSTCIIIIFVMNVVFSATQTPFFFALARRRIPVFIWILMSVAILAHIFSGIDALLNTDGSSWFSAHKVLLMSGVSLPAHMVLAFAPLIAFWPFNRITPRMRPVAILCFLWGTADIVWFVVQGIGFLAVPGMENLFTHRLAAMLEMRAFTTAAVLAALFGLLFRDQRRVAEERALLAGEMASAREIQQYLIPEKLPPTPGLAIHSVYQPSREVGGDFFQVLPDPRDGSTLIVVGDVAGKGLKAGMLAALIVGAIRTAFKFTSDPGSILALLNERLQGRGLVTCLAMRVDRNGSIELANAGHLPPYLNGRELALEGAFPLGALPAASFPIQRFQLSEGESLLLVSDGVVEARNATTGELFGFERTRSISTHTADQIADAAKQFGQDDDITVLTLALAPAEVLHA
jgi:hypothetical protein